MTNIKCSRQLWQHPQDSPNCHIHSPCQGDQWYCLRCLHFDLCSLLTMSIRHLAKEMSLLMIHTANGCIHFQCHSQGLMPHGQLTHKQKSNCSPMSINNDRTTLLPRTEHKLKWIEILHSGCKKLKMPMPTKTLPGGVKAPGTILNSLCDQGNLLSRCAGHQLHLVISVPLPRQQLMTI